MNTHYSPTDAIIDARSLDRLPKRLKAIVLESPETRITQASVTIAGGYNTDLSVEEAESNDGGRRVTDVTLNFEPGAGLGKTDGCTQELVIRRINGQAADANGNFLLDALDCYRVQRPAASYDSGAHTIELVPNTLELNNDCEPCCDCDDYLAVYEAIRVLRQAYYELGVRATDARDAHRENIWRWKNAGAARAANPLRLTVLPLSCCQLGVTGAYCNSSGAPLDGLELRFRLSGDIEGAPVCGQAFRAGNFNRVNSLTAGRASAATRERYEMSGDWPVYSANFDRIPDGGMALVTFVLDFQGCVSGTAIDVDLGAYNPSTGAQMQYDTTWPDGESFDVVDQLNVRSTIYSGDPCDDESTCGASSSEDSSSGSSAAPSSSGSSGADEPCCSTTPTSFTVTITGVPPLQTCVAYDPGGNCTGYNQTFTVPVGGDSGLSGVCDYQTSISHAIPICFSSTACLGVQLDGRVAGRLDVYVLVMQECGTIYARFKKSFTGLPADVNCVSLLRNVKIPYQATVGDFYCKIEQATVRITANA